MTRVVLALFLLAATTALSFAPIYCALEVSDSVEPCCELCHAGDMVAAVPAAAGIAVASSAPSDPVPQARSTPRRFVARSLRDRGPPR